jgi:NADH:ubiquinone oxidoreductase subunit 3 (subunit A)
MNTDALHALLPSSWDTYYVVFLAALLGVGIPAILRLVSKAFFNRSRPLRRLTRDEQETASQLGLLASAQSTSDRLGSKINVRFFLGTNASFLLIALGLLLIPCIGTLHEKSLSSRGLISIVSLAAMASLGLFYAVKKGDLTWQRSFQKTSAQATAPVAEPKEPLSEEYPT